MHFVETLEQRRLLAVTPVPFQHFTVDPAPGNAPVEKLLADIDGDGKLDAVIGLNFTGSDFPGGMYWYEFPHSGNPADTWNKYVIAPPGNASYEDSAAYDLNQDGALDVIASYKGNLVWFENPKGHGGDPRSGAWAQHSIGSGSAHEMTMADLDGDGKIDIATNAQIFFQNSATSWTTISTSAYSRAEKGVATFDSGSGLGSVDLVGIAKSPYPIVWFENPRDHGGNARTDVWTTHKIGDNYLASDTSIGICFATTDVNNDGRMDVITTHGESTNNSSHPGGLVWWEAPFDRANGVWIKHVIDNNLQNSHRIKLADMNKDGLIDIVFAEQEQSNQDRVGIYYKLDRTGDNWQMQVLSVGSGHNQDVGDINGDGALDILNAPHGVYTGIRPVEVYLSQLNGISSNVPDGWNDADIGSPGMPGSAASLDGSNWTVSGGGAEIFNGSDQFNLVSHSAGPYATLIAKVTSLTVTDPSSKAGLMLRASNDAGSAFADVVATPSNGVAFQWRTASGALTGDAHVSGIPGAPQWIKLIREGDTFSAFYGSNGSNWIQIGASKNISMPSIVLGGLATTARNNAMLNTAVFSNFSITSPTPTAVDDMVHAKINKSVVAAVLANDQPGAGPFNPATVQIVGGPFFGQAQVDSVTGKINYTPDPDFSSVDIIRYTVQDVFGQTTNIASLYIMVMPNQPPTVSDDGKTTRINSPININVLGNDIDPDGTINATTVSISTSAQNGSTTIDPVTGMITYLPNNNYAGSDEFFYTVKDDEGAESSPAKVTIAVNPNALPAAANDSATIVKNVAGAINVLSNDTDSDGTINPATVAIATPAQHGSLGINSTTGVVTYTPQQDYVGADDFYYTVNDNDGGQSPSAHVLLTVNPPAPTSVYLSDLNPTTAQNGYGSYERDKSNGENGSNDGHAIKLAGQTYAKGLGVHAASTLIYNLNGQYSQFLVDIGVDDEVGSKGSVVFQVYLDSIKVYDSGKMTGSSATKSITQSVTGKTQLKLVVTDGGNGKNSDHADWAGARLLAAPVSPFTAVAAASASGSSTDQRKAANLIDTITI